jgi:hypothetical protein
MPRLIDNLGLNFSNEKFQQALDPYGDIGKTLKKQPSMYKKWQFDAVANNDSGGYFQNPMASISTEIRNAANTMYTSSYGVTSLETIKTTAGLIAGYDVTTGDSENPPIVTTHTTGIIELFVKHTNNISGVTASTSASFPDFNSGLAIGEYMMQLTSRYDGQHDASAALGAFTSLFIGDEIGILVIKINDGALRIKNSITIEVGGGEGAPTYTYTTNLSATQISTIQTDVTTCYNLINDRYNHDINFFRKSMETMTKFNQISKFNSLSKISLHLIDNFVGTDKLKSKL